MKYDTLILLLIITLLIALSYISIPIGEVSEAEGVKKFSSEQDFKSYLQESKLTGLEYFGFGAVGTRALAETTTQAIAEESKTEPTRVSETNVQVAGIDEPDIVKTDGKQIYFSSYGYRYWWGVEKISYQSQWETKVVKAFPPSDMSVEAKIEKNGDLLLYNNVLVIFSGDKIYGYDVSIPESPKELWKIELNSSMISARLFNGKIYLITGKTIDQYHPCPIKPLTRDGVAVIIECSSIYYPVEPIQVDATYNAIILNPESGNVEKTVSFVGSSGSSVVYMSTNAIYVTYSYLGDIVEIFSNFFRENSDLIPSYIIEKVDKLKDYDISMQSKITELYIILDQYQSSLSEDERMRFENELSDRMADYSEEHKREFMKTGIAKIGLDMNVLGAGNVPGTPLNQFSLDEYEVHLRIAVTVGGWWWMSSTKTANDVYVLDNDLNIVGSVKDLGLTERIYSVRFLQDKGYLVTFRQTDPFYVLDLADPAKPELKGELKIPGYSSYLHPITKDKILGIGKDGSNVKVSLFDVASTENPRELDKYSLSEYWSDILNTHHAFLLDDKHEIFFLPGSRGGYVFSYNDDELKLVKTVSEITAKRAVYIEDFLYIIGDDKIVVLDENSWERTNEIEF